MSLLIYDNESGIRYAYSCREWHGFEKCNIDIIINEAILNNNEYI